MDYLLLPREQDAIELVNSVFLRKETDCELHIDTEAKPYFDKFFRNFDKTKIVLLLSFQDKGRYDFIVDPDTDESFAITLTVSAFDRPSMWIHTSSMEGYQKMYRRKLNQSKAK